MQNAIRVKNLSQLACEYSSQANLAQHLGIEHREIIKYFKNKNTPIPDNLARQIEVTLNRPIGWMDRPNFDLALTAEEWQLLQAYRTGGVRDKMYLMGVAQLTLAHPVADSKGA